MARKANQQHVCKLDDSISIESIFILQMVYMLATDAPITIRKRGTTLIIQGRTNKASFSAETLPSLLTVLEHFRRV
jgi:hypothetical protein